MGVGSEMRNPKPETVNETVKKRKRKRKPKQQNGEMGEWWRRRVVESEPFVPKDVFVLYLTGKAFVKV